ncbi:MAG TPA: hypothetical protein VJG32_11500 [Anaerolineae bacterium]|nr:hypothetical protein [Anaerolineae bacterium]
MTSRPLAHSQFYKVLVIALSIALILSTIPLQGWSLLFGMRIAYAAPNEIASASILLDRHTGLTQTVNSPVMQTLQNASLPSELANLTKPDVIVSGEQISGMVTDIGATQAVANSVQREPNLLTNPLSISRVQSAYRAADAVSGTLMITFTVTNNQPPTLAPQLPFSATITDTIAAISTFDFSKDPDTIRNVLLTNSLTSYTSFVSSSPEPDRSTAQYAWSLGDIPPLSSVTATLTVHGPTIVADFVDLDMGAIALGTLQGRLVSAQARPASLAPNTINGESIGDWLQWTVDADKYDKYMLAKAAELGQDPLHLFEYVRSLGYESYKGSLRGTRGTLWSEAGNSLDRASLLIAMLRASGVPAPESKPHHPGEWERPSRVGAWL